VDFTQDLFTQRRNYADGTTRINEDGRIWYDSTTNTLRIGNGVPGGHHISTGGDQGPIRSLTFDRTGPGTVTTPGMLTWNEHEDCVEVYQADGTVLQLGLEAYIQVYNNTANTMVNGTVVRFSGVFADEIYTPEAAPLLADGSVPPLYVIGVLTANIAAGNIGRATVLGKVHDVDTTGSSVGETWAVGTLLWAHPDQAGKMTSVMPTAPDIQISVAAVLKVGATDGVLLVRPTIWPRLYYGSFSSTQTQYANVALTPYAVTLTTTDIASGHHLANSSQIVADAAGLYNYQFSIQVLSTNASAKSIWIWPRKNGVDIPNSASQLTVVGNNEYKIAAWNFIVSMQIGNYFELMWAVSDSALRIPSPPAESFCPAIPSVILTVTQAAL